jgi:hypothetical protein
MRLILLLSFLLSSPASGFAKSRYTILDDTLTLDMRVEEPGYEFDGALDEYDETEVISYLFDNPQIKTLRVTGPGGYMPTASAIAEYLIRHDINTEAIGECDSACAQIFLGGKTRTLAPGAKLGFHRPHLVKEREKQFYEENHVKKGWKDRFDYGIDTYDLAMLHMVKRIEYMLSRGVDMDFILKRYTTSSYDMWYPSREELLEAGVLTE